jgi:hypothetical protein
LTGEPLQFAVKRASWAQACEASFLLPRYSGSSLGDQDRPLLERGVGECTEGASVSQLSLNGSAITCDAGSAAAMSMARSSLMTALLGSTQNRALSGNCSSAGHRRPLIQEQLVDHQSPNQEHHERQCDRDRVMSRPSRRHRDLEIWLSGPVIKGTGHCRAQLTGATTPGSRGAGSCPRRAAPVA